VGGVGVFSWVGGFVWGWSFYRFFYFLFFSFFPGSAPSTGYPIRRPLRGMSEERPGHASVAHPCPLSAPWSSLIARFFSPIFLEPVSSRRRGMVCVGTAFLPWSPRAGVGFPVHFLQTSGRMRCHAFPAGPCAPLPSRLASLVRSRSVRWAWLSTSAGHSLIQYQLRRFRSSLRRAALSRSSIAVASIRGWSWAAWEA
jgi:hypothetical protein